MTAKFGLAFVFGVCMNNKNNVDPAPLEPLVRRPIRLSRNGLPVDPKDWSQADWADLHDATECAKVAIKKRYIKGGENAAARPARQPPNNVPRGLLRGGQ